MTTGEEAAARCGECRQLRDAHYQGEVTGWYVDDAGERHNHFAHNRSRPASHCLGAVREEMRDCIGKSLTIKDFSALQLHARYRGAARSYEDGQGRRSYPMARATPSEVELTPEDKYVAAQMGLSLDDVLKQKKADRRIEMKGRLDVLELVQRFEERGQL